MLLNEWLSGSERIAQGKVMIQESGRRKIRRGKKGIGTRDSVLTQYSMTDGLLDGLGVKRR